MFLYGGPQISWISTGLLCSSDRRQRLAHAPVPACLPVGVRADGAAVPHRLAPAALETALALARRWASFYRQVGASQVGAAAGGSRLCALQPLLCCLACGLPCLLD